MVEGDLDGTALARILVEDLPREKAMAVKA
jgi:hypothetical protein